MGKTLLVGTDLIIFMTVTLAWDCSDREERNKHTWCDHGCCFEKDPVRCCTWAESMGSVFWTLMGLGAGMLVLSIIVGIVCCFRKKRASEGQVISQRQESSREGSGRTRVTPSAPSINPSHAQHTIENIWTISDETGASSGYIRPSSNNVSSSNNNNNNFTNNTNTGANQHTSSQPDSLGSAEQPPSYESLPPSYSSLFKTNG